MPYTELGGSPRESLNESSGSSAERRFLIAWSDRLTFAQDMVGTAYPSFPQSRVVAVELQPWTEELIASGTITDAALDMIQYGGQPCLATVKYGPDFTQKDWPSNMPKPSFRAGTELRYQVRGSGKFLLVPSSVLKWEEDEGAPVPEDANTAIVIPMRSIQIQWDFVDDPPVDVLDDLVGGVNADSFLGCPPECLLFESYDVIETFRAAPANPHTNRLTLQFTRRVIDTGSELVGWNHDFSEDPIGWQRMLMVNDEPRYLLKDMADMFT